MLELICPSLDQLGKVLDQKLNYWKLENHEALRWCPHKFMLIFKWNKYSVGHVHMASLAFIYVRLSFHFPYP